MNKDDKQFYSTLFLDSLHDYKKDTGLTVKEIAVLVGVSYRTVESWLSGKSLPNFYAFIACISLDKFPMKEWLIL